MMAKRTLSPEDWIMAGFDALGRGGVDALRAEAIARDLDTTKGSFYWHFKDLPTYKTAILDFWHNRATAEIITAVEGEPDPLSRLTALIALATAVPCPLGSTATEPAIREWARHDPLAAKVVAQVDAQRLAFLSNQLQGMGGDAEQKARLIYAAHIGLELLAPASGSTGGDDLRLLLRLLSD